MNRPEHAGSVVITKEGTGVAAETWLCRQWVRVVAPSRRLWGGACPPGHRGRHQAAQGWVGTWRWVASRQEGPCSGWQQLGRDRRGTL